MTGLALYPRILGDEWERLAEPVRRCHDAAPELVANGRFTVKRARSWIARATLAIARMPAAGENVALRLEVRAHADHQIWKRSFDGFTMTTVQRVLPCGRMAERRGPIELLFRVSRNGDGIDYEPDGLRLCLGPIRIPLPSWLGPRVAARTWTIPGERSMHVEITLALSFLGTIITYGGPLVAAPPIPSRTRREEEEEVAA